MGWVLMSERELNRVEVLSQVITRSDDGCECGERFGTEPQAASPASEEVSI